MWPSYAHTIKYKLINCSWAVVGRVAAVGKGPNFLQKNRQQNFLAMGLLDSNVQPQVDTVAKPWPIMLNVYLLYYAFEQYSKNCLL